MAEETLTAPMPEAGADTGAEDTDLSGLETSEQVETESTQQTEATEEQTAEQSKPEESQQENEEPELSEFRGIVSGKLRGMVKDAPELAQIFKKYPKLQDRIEATFRREAALRDVFPTVAEARFMRDQFPNGQADVQALISDVKEIEEVDNNFEVKDRDGNYAGHPKLIDNFFQRDKSAAVSLFRTLPKEWARLDRESYDDVMGKIVGATFQQRGTPEFVQELRDAAKTAEQPELERGLNQLLNWMNGFVAERSKPSDEQMKLDRDRAAFERQRSEETRTGNVRWHNDTFMPAALKLQREIIGSHPAIKRLENVTSISKEKRQEIIEQVRSNMEKLLAKSPSFIRKWRPMYQGRNLVEMDKLQRAAWSQPWLINGQVRRVLQKETPQMVSQNRAAVQRRAGTVQQKTPAKPGERTAPRVPHQIGGVWYKADGSRFTTAEVIAGKHLT